MGLEGPFECDFVLLMRSSSQVPQLHVLYPEETNFSCVKFTGGTSLLLRFFTFSGLEAVLAISAVMIFSDIQPEPHIALRMARDPDC
jgi:hypothetical protein